MGIIGIPLKAGEFLMSRLLTATLVAGTMLLSPAAYAAPKSSPVPGAAKAERVNVITNRLKQLNSRVSNDTASVAVPAGFSNNLGGNTTLTCPGNANLGCIISFEASVQMSNVTAGNFWAICGLVNGAFLSCPYVGILPTTG